MSTLSRRDFVQAGAAASLGLASSPAGADKQAAGPGAENPWLVMVYMAGDNSLSEDMVLALQDLKAEGPLDGDKIVAQFDPSGVGLSAQRYDFSSPRGATLESYRDPDFNPGEISTGSRAALVGFICDAHKKYPQPKQHLLILCGHGSGATEDFLMKDDASKDALTIDEFKGALADATGGGDGALNKKIDVLGLDACYMSMGEVAYEVRESVHYMIGAEGLEPAFGWPYRKILTAARAFLRDKGRHMEPAELATVIVRAYVDHYEDYDRSAGRSVDLAAMDLTRIEGVKHAFAGLVRALKEIDPAGHEKLLLAHWYAQTYKNEQFVDLRDLCERMRIQFGQNSKIGTRCGAVMAAIAGGTGACVIKSGCSGFACQFSHGLSIYFPWAAVSPDYQDLAFAKETGWLEFLQAHVMATRRPPRYSVTPQLPIDVQPRRELIKKLLAGPEAPGDAPVPDVQRAILGRLRGLQALRAGALQPGVLEKAADRVAQTDALAQDYPREISRRVARAGALRDLESRYSNHTRYSDHTRYLGDREKAVKNLPPAIGKAYSPND